MDTPSNDAIRFANDESYDGSSSNNWYIFLFAVIITLFAVYWGFIRPTTRQLTKMRRYVTSLESSIAELNGKRADNQETVSLLDQLIEQNRLTHEASASLAEVRSLHQQIIKEASQLQSAQQALQSLAALRTEVARQSSLIEATQRALANLEELHLDVQRSAGETEVARAAVEELSVVRDGLIESMQQVDATKPLIAGINELHSRLTATSNRATDAQFALDELVTLGDRIEAQAANVEQAESTFESMVGLQQKIVNQTLTTATAIETLELATDVQYEMKQASQTFSQIKRMLAEMTLMRPQLQQAVECLQPMLELTDLRRLSVSNLRSVASMVRERYLEATIDQGAREIVADASEIGNVE